LLDIIDLGPRVTECGLCGEHMTYNNANKFAKKEVPGSFQAFGVLLVIKNVTDAEIESLILLGFFPNVKKWIEHGEQKTEDKVTCVMSPFLASLLEKHGVPFVPLLMDGLLSDCMVALAPMLTIIDGGQNMTEGVVITFLLVPGLEELGIGLIKWHNPNMDRGNSTKSISSHTETTGSANLDKIVALITTVYSAKCHVEGGPVDRPDKPDVQDNQNPSAVIGQALTGKEGCFNHSSAKWPKGIAGRGILIAHDIISDLLGEYDLLVDEYNAAYVYSHCIRRYSVDKSLSEDLIQHIQTLLPLDMDIDQFVLHIKAIHASVGNGKSRKK
jgi:hypothetical protein